MIDIYALLKKIRNERGISLREAAKRSGLSHSYIDSLEKGIHPKTKAPIRPSPDILKALATAYNYDYFEMMSAAEYVDGDEKERVEYTLSESEYERIIKETEAEFKVSLKGDPVVEGAVRELIRRLAQMKQK